MNSVPTKQIAHTTTARIKSARFATPASPFCGSVIAGLALLLLAGCSSNASAPPRDYMLPYGQAPHGHGPHGQAPHGHGPRGQSPNGRGPNGRGPKGQQTPAPTPSAATQRYRPKVAVLPIDESTLFRAERVTIRNALAAKLKQLMPKHELLSLAEVDAALAPVSSDGKACAYSHDSDRQRADDRNWLSTDVSDVLRSKSEAAYMHVRVSRRFESSRTFSADWVPGTLTQRYAGTIPKLKADSMSGGGLGLLGSLTGSRKGEHRQGELRVCESNGAFSCSDRSASWADKATAITACYANVPTGSDQLLIDSNQRCEGTNLHATVGAKAKRTKCLCQAIVGSKGWKAKSGRRRVRFHFESAKLKDRQRPQLRVASSTSNVRTDTRTIGTSHWSARYLKVANQQRLADALAGCAPLPDDVTVVAELGLSGTGNITSVRLALPGSITSSKGTVAVPNVSNKNIACLRKAMRDAKFDCTRNGKPGTMTMTVTWPKPKADKK